MQAIFVVLLLLAARMVYADDTCPKKSVEFGFCVGNSIADHSTTAKDKEDLEQQILKDCEAERKAHIECGGIDKTAYVDEFIKRQVEFFKPDRPKTVVKRADEDAPEKSLN